MVKFSYKPSLLSAIYQDTWKALTKLCAQFNKFIKTHHTTSYTKVRWNSTHIFICLICFVTFIYNYTSIEIKPELQKNILKFGYGINYKYEGMLAHLFDRFYVVTKFFLPMVDDLKLSPINYNKKCKHIYDLDDNDNEKIKTHIKDLITYCIKLRPYMAFYKM